MEKKLNGIVLRSVSYKDNDAILNIFTLEEGIVSAKIKGVKKAGAKLKFATQPFCFAEFVLLKSGDKYTVINASLHDGFYSLRENVFSFYAGSVMLEIANIFFSESVENEEAFLLLSKGLNELCYGKENNKTVLIKFLISTLALTGYGLYFDKCVKCGCDIDRRVFFSPQTGGFLCEECLEPGSFEIYFETYKALLDVSMGKSANEESFLNCLKLLSFYITEKTEVEIKSLTEFIRLNVK